MVVAPTSPTPVAMRQAASVGAAVLAVAGWMWARAFPTHNAWARAALEQERVKGQTAVADERRRTATIEERLKAEVENSRADARRGHAGTRLYRELRVGRAYIAEGMPPGVSGVAPLFVLINWTNRVADDLKLLGISVAQLESGGSPAVAAGSTDRGEVQAEFERRLDVLEDLIDRRLV